ncbi:MAG: choice-of-anchor B family protein [Flavobacteriales bacterium]
MTHFYLRGIFIAACTVALFTAKAQTPCVNGMAGTYPCQNVDLLAFVPLSEMGNGANTNDIWGWVSPATGKEYALVGCSNGTAFLDISNPVEPVYIGILPTHTQTSLWRDIEVYNNYCFAVSEANNHGLQVFDLMELDGVTNPPVEFDESAFYGEFGHCHTLTIDVQSGFCYCNGTGTYNGGLHIVNIQDPLNPTLAGGFDIDGYTHDSFAWTYDGPDPDYAGHELVFACNEDELTIVDCTDKTDCQLIQSYSYDNVGYIHQGWITKDKSHFLIDDELDEQELGNDGITTGTRTHIFDVTDLDNSDYQGFFESTSPSIDHNLYVLDQFVYESNYRSGVRVLDAVKVDDGLLKQVGFFDLYPANDNAQFSGTWSNYPYLPSGVNLATHMYEGFYILQPKLITLAQDNFDLCGVNQIVLDVTVNAEIAFPVTFAVENLGSVSVSANPLEDTGNAIVTISELNSLTPGTYQATLALQTTFGEQYEVPFTVTYSGGSPLVPVLVNVPDNSLVSNTANTVVFEWQNDITATGYTFQLSAMEDFSTLIENQNTTENNYVLSFDLPDGTYFWRVTASNECGAGQWSDVFEFQVTFVGVNEMRGASIGVYPNPADNELKVSGVSGGDQIVITDFSGRVVLSTRITGGLHTETLDISDFAPGSYLMQVGNNVVKWVKY